MNAPERPELRELLFAALDLTNASRPDDQQIPRSGDAILFGRDGHLDSMGLVAFLMDVEDALLEQGHEVSLNDERAMSQKRSPFRDIDSLEQYISELLEDQPA